MAMTASFTSKKKVLLAFWAILALALVVTNLFGWLAYSSFESMMVRERRHRLTALASLASTVIAEDFVAFDELERQGMAEATQQALRQSLADRLQSFINDNALVTAVVLNIENETVVSTSPLDEAGQKPAWVPLFEEQILEAWQGKAAATDPIYQGNEILQSAFAPVSDGADIARAVLWVEGDNQFLLTERDYIRHLFLMAGLTSLVVLFLCGLVVRSLVSSYLDAGEALARAERLSAVGRLAAGVSHEIRNPLSIMTTTCQFLQGELVDGTVASAQHRQLLDDVLEEIDRLNGIVTRFLALARAPAQADCEQSAALDAVLREVKVFVERSFTKRRVSLVLEDEGPLPTVPLSAERMKQVLLNLLLNGADALEGQGGTITVSVTVEGTSDEVSVADGRSPASAVVVRLTVADDGPGFPAEILARPCEPFQTTKDTGTGLGLSMVKTLVEAAGGTVTLANRPRGGAEVTVTLPGTIEPATPKEP